MEKEITKEKLAEYVRLWKKYERSYFWSPYDLSALRRKAERDNTYHLEFSFDGHDYVMDIVMNQSARHVYVSRQLTQDGRKVTIRTLTKYIKGTDDGIVADPETSFTDVCRPETGK